MFLSLCFCPFPWSINISFDNLFTLQEFGDRINVNYHSWFHPSYLHNHWAPRRIYNPDWCRHRYCTGIPAPSIGDLQHIKIANMNKDLIMSHLFTRMSARLNHMLAHSLYWNYAQKTTNWQTRFRITKSVYIPTKLFVTGVRHENLLTWIWWVKRFL